MDATPDDPLLAVRRAAELARLELTDEEAEALGPEFGRILAAFEALARWPLPDGAPPAAPDPGRTRPDEPRPSLPRERLLANAPEGTDEFYSVPKTIGGDA